MTTTGEMASRALTTLNITGVSADSHGRVFAGYADNSIHTTFHGGTHFHQHPERSETPPSPLSTVPFKPNPDFVCCGTLLDKIHNKASVPGSRIALVGLGGVGKSQLAIEYSYRVRCQSPETWVFWIHASNAARFEQSFREVADQVKVPGRQDPNANIFRLVENWLRDRKRGKWVLILDNVDDDEFLRKVPATGQECQINGRINALTKPLLEYLPRSPNGSIVVTTRTKEVALGMVDHNDIIEIEPMQPAEALELLQRKLALPRESPETIKLVEELEFIPLAIVQAAAYIKHREPRYSVSRYLEKFRKSDREAIRLLDYEGGHLYRDWEAKNSILVTWHISFDHIRRISPSAADLLSLMSFFDRQGISDNLLRVQRETKNDEASSEDIANDSGDDDTDSTSGSETDRFEDDITTLRDYSFISVGEDSSVFTMHRLVQLTALVWLRAHGQMEQWKEQFIRNLWREFPTGEYENWEKCRSLFPHVKSAMSQRPKSEESLRQWATLLYRGAWYAWQSGNIADVREMASKSTEQRVKILGVEDKETLDSTTMLATAYELEGQWEEAEKLQVQVMEAQMTRLGKEHLSTLASMNNLASTYEKQGRWEEAEKLQVQVMETSKAKLGEDHPFTLTGMANLASTYRSQGRWEEAEKFFVQVIETSKIKLGEDHPDTLASVANLALTYGYHGRLEEAEKLFVQVIETSKIKLGEDHPDTLRSMGSLASAYEQQGRWEEAEKLQVQVMETRRTKLGGDHPDTLTSMANLATAYGKQGRWEEAEQLIMQVIETSKAKLGEDHPDTLTSMGNLAYTYYNQGRWEEAEKLQVQVMQTSKAKLGEDHPFTLTGMANLAFTYYSQGRWEEAEKLQVQVIQSRHTKLGEDHPDMLSSMNNLAVMYHKQGRWEEAEQLFVRVMENHKTKLGDDHPDTLTSMGNLASTYRSQSRWEEAEKLQVQVMQTRKMNLGESHASTLTSMESLASTLGNLGRWEEAEKLQLQVIQARKTNLGEEHPDTLTSMGNLVLTYWNQGRWEEAEKLQMQVMQTSKIKLGEDHPSTLASMINLMRIMGTKPGGRRS